MISHHSNRMVTKTNILILVAFLDDIYLSKLIELHLNYPEFYVIIPFIKRYHWIAPYTQENDYGQETDCAHSQQGTGVTGPTCLLVLST